MESDNNQSFENQDETKPKLSIKRILLYIFAFPIGIVASAVLPKLFEYPIRFFIPFEFIREFLITYFLKLISGWIVVAITMLLAPSRKIVYGVVVVLLNLASAIFLYTNGQELNYLFIIGGVIALTVYSTVGSETLEKYTWKK